VDECFEGLRDGEGSFQDATKESVDGLYCMRLALETADRSGTSGTSPWSAFRFALETPDGNICITDEGVLADALMVTHHNCADVLTISSGDRRYVIDNPDSAVDYGDPNSWRRPATLTLFEGDTMIGEPIRLDTVSCNDTSDAEQRCISGGPC
jgi:hypothetical protein